MTGSNTVLQAVRPGQTQPPRTEVLTGTTDKDEEGKKIEVVAHD